jgi:peptide/nickel transport system permease protein
MWAFIIRKLVYNIPVYLAIIFLLMVLLRQRDPVAGMLGKNASPEDYQAKRTELGLTEPFYRQYFKLVKSICTLDFSQEVWNEPGVTVGEKLWTAVPRSLALTVPALVITTVISIFIAMLSAFYRGRWIDRLLVFFAVLGMSVSFLVYIIFGQYFGAYKLQQWVGSPIFSIHGYESGILNWPFYMLLPVLISVIVAMGYDTRFYRAVMVEETQADYITTARAKGASQSKVMFVHMLRNAMIPIVTRVMITLPFLVTGSILLEEFFGIPGMGYVLLSAIRNNDFPVVEGFTAVFAGLFILSIIATDILYAVFDPRVRLQ